MPFRFVSRRYLYQKIQFKTSYGILDILNIFLWPAVKIVMATTKKKEIWFIRHAESQGNTGEWGGPDPLLSVQGELQACKLKGSVELLVVSPLKRTLQTYALSDMTSTRRLVFSELFRERRGDGLGEYMAGEDPKTCKETDVQFCQRLEEARQFLLDQPESKIAVVTHSVFLAAFTHRFYGSPHYFRNAEVLHLKLR